MSDIQFHFAKPEESPGYLLWQVTMLWQRKIKRELDKLNITHTQFVLLAALAWLSRENKIVTQIDLANLSKTDRMMVSKVLRTLQKKGFITRTEHVTDTRAKSVALTSKGKDLLQVAIKVVEQGDITFFSVLDSQLELFNKQLFTILKENG